MPTTVLSPSATPPAVAAATPARPPAARVGWAMLWEAAGLWLLFLVLGMAWLAGSLWMLERGQAEDLQQQRLALTLMEIKEAVEGDLALGLDLVGHPQAQALLDTALERNRELRSIDIALADGTTVFSTDRGAVGEALPPTVWAEARRDGDTNRLWTAQVAGEPLIGSGLRGPFGEPAGYVVSAYRAEGAPWPTLRAWGVVVLAMALTLAAALVAARRLLRRAVPDEDALAPSLAAAQATRQRFEASLGQIDEHEGGE